MTVQAILFEDFTNFQYEQKLQESIDLILTRNNLSNKDYSLSRFSEGIGLLRGNLNFNIEFRIFDFKNEGKLSQLECYKSLKNDYYEFTQSIFK